MSEIDVDIKSILGGAPSIREQTAACIAWAEAVGVDYRKASNLLKGELIAKFVAFKNELQRARLLLPVARAMQSGLKNRKGTGNLRKHFRRTFLYIALQRCCGVRRQSASRWARIAETLEREGVEPKDFGQEIHKRGMKNILPPPKKRQKTPSSKADRPTDDHDEPRDTEDVYAEPPAVANVTKNRAPIHSSNTDGCVKSSQLQISISDLVLRGLGALSDGPHVFAVVLHKLDDLGHIGFVNLDPLIGLNVCMKISARLPSRTIGTLTPELRRHLEEKFGRKMANSQAGSGGGSGNCSVVDAR